MSHPTSSCPSTHRSRVRWLGAAAAWAAMAALALGSVPACDSDACGTGFENPEDCEGGGFDAASTLNGSISGSYSLNDPDTDPTIDVGTDSGGTAEANPGGTVNVALQFNAPNANVIGGGIRFGTNGPVHVVTIPDAEGQTSGTLSFAVEIPPSVCDNLSQICHDIKCYEFAVTSAGKVSQANINDVALACGGCDEPSCQSLLTSCNATGCNCNADEVCIDGTCEPKTAATSCELREPQCCPGQDNNCTAPDAQCFCDEYCATAGDCCPDACSVCGYCN